MRKFAIVEKFKDQDINLPKRGTASSAGYDIECAEDTYVPSIWETGVDRREQLGDTFEAYQEYVSKVLLSDGQMNEEMEEELNDAWEHFDAARKGIEKLFKVSGTLVPTGLKVYCNPGEYVALVSRSSNFNKKGLMLANNLGVIDADYVDNPDNEGHIMFNLINFGLTGTTIKKGERIGQAIFHSFLTTDDDDAEGKRTGGFGSTGN